MLRRLSTNFLPLLALVLFAAVPARAQQGIPQVLEDVKLVNKIGGKISLDLQFVDEEGATIILRDYFNAADKKPVVIVPVYFTCPSLCNYTLNAVVDVLKKLNYTPGTEFDIVTISFDPAETAALAKAKKANYIREYGRDEAAAGWHFLTGKQQNLQQLMDELGFRYKYNKETEEYMHSSATYVIAPDGTISRYFSSIQFDPEDLRLALVEASNGKLGTVIDQLVLFCAHYDPQTGKYTIMAVRVMQLAGGATILLLGGTIGGLLLLERRRRKTNPDLNDVGQAPRPA